MTSRSRVEVWLAVPVGMAPTGTARSNQADDAFLVGEDADDIGTALSLLVEPPERVGAVQLDPVLLGEGHVSAAHIIIGKMP